MRKNNIVGQEVKEVFASLKQNVKLFYLDLKDNDLEDECAEKIIDLLKVNYFIEDLVIEGNSHMS